MSVLLGSVFFSSLWCGDWLLAWLASTQNAPTTIALTARGKLCKMGNYEFHLVLLLLLPLSRVLSCCCLSVFLILIIIPCLLLKVAGGDRGGVTMKCDG